MRIPTDNDARVFATDPSNNVVLEASAGTGKTSVLVDRYLNLLRAGVEPANILAITFTRQAAAEMRERIIEALRRERAESATAQQRWADVRERLSEIAINTLDAFCLSLLREFPLEADLDPGFAMADETEVPRLVDEAVDRAHMIAAAASADDAGIAALLARIGPQRTRIALAMLLERRLVAPSALQRFLRGVPRDLTPDHVCQGAVARLRERFQRQARDLVVLTQDGVSGDPQAALLAHDLDRCAELADADPASIRAWLERLRSAFVTKAGEVRRSYPLGTNAAAPIRRRYRQSAARLAPLVRDELARFDRDVNVLMARAVQRIFGIVTTEYQRTLRARALLDFTDVQQRAVDLLRHMDEFARSRYRLESRYHHVLVDEFQDTSRTQWELVSLLVQSWGEGSGLVADAPLAPSIFVVGDRKQSIYRFRDADVTTFGKATDDIAELRDTGQVRRTIAESFRSVGPLLAFVNDLFSEIASDSTDPGSFRFGGADRFPLTAVQHGDHSNDALGVIVGPDIARCAEAVASEVVDLLDDGAVRTPDGSTRAVTPRDIAVLFRTRESHREFGRALDKRGVPTYVYKGLGFFDAEEIKDVRALIRFLANPASELRTAALLRSRLIGVSDSALSMLAGGLSRALIADDVSAEITALDEYDRQVLEQARRTVGGWLGMVDRLSPAELLDRALGETAYAYELAGSHVEQAEANLRRFRGLVRTLQNRGYATMARVADHIDRLSTDMSNAVVEAFDAVNLMTVHAAKGLEFPVVFLVDIGRGARARDAPVRIVPDRGDGSPSVTVWPYRSDADEQERRRDVEETKRLMYVATTRARDRLYLSAVIDKRGPRFAAGSFGSILPSTFTPILAAAAVATPGERVTWQAPDGGVHELRVPERSATATATEETPCERPAVIPSELGPVPFRPAVSTKAVTSQFALLASSAEPVLDVEVDVTERQVGQVVHAMLRLRDGQPSELAQLEELARQLLVDVEPPTGDDLIAHVTTAYARLVRQADLAPSSPQRRRWEVPFSYWRPDKPGAPVGAGAAILRGTIDCLDRGQDGGITVLEFKTGRPRPEHQQQLELYVAAARALFPGSSVQGQLVYP